MRKRLNQKRFWWFITFAFAAAALTLVRSTRAVLLEPAAAILPIFNGVSSAGRFDKDPELVRSLKKKNSCEGFAITLASS